MLGAAYMLDAWCAYQLGLWMPEFYCACARTTPKWLFARARARLLATRSAPLFVCSECTCKLSFLGPWRIAAEERRKETLSYIDLSCLKKRKKKLTSCKRTRRAEVSSQFNVRFYLLKLEKPALFGKEEIS